MDLDGWCAPRLIPSGGGGSGGWGDDETPKDGGGHMNGGPDVGQDVGSDVGQDGDARDMDDEPLSIHRDGPQEPWEHRGPDGFVTRYEQSWWYTLTRGGQTWRALVACTRRQVYHALRGHVTVFKAARAQPKHRALPRLYLWTTFVETDMGSYCAVIPDPAHPKFKLAAGDPVPKRFHGQQLPRADQLFNGMRRAPSLRLVVAADDYLSMIKHAFWAADLRGKL